MNGYFVISTKQCDDKTMKSAGPNLSKLNDVSTTKGAFCLRAPITRHTIMNCIYK